jgi:hypothetical protein
LLAQKRKFFLKPRRRNNAPTVSNTPPTGSKPRGTSDSMRKRYDSDAEQDGTEGDVDPCPCSYVTLEEKNSSKTIIDEAHRQRHTDN